MAGISVSGKTRQRYYVENVRELLVVPGPNWYLDFPTRRVSYWPMPGEKLGETEIVRTWASCSHWAGDADRGCLRSTTRPTRGLAAWPLHHADWPWPQGHSDPQAVVTVPAAVMADGARHCVSSAARSRTSATYGLWLRRGCKHCRIVHNRSATSASAASAWARRRCRPSDEAESSDNLVDNNHLFDGGHVYPAGIGIWVAQSSHNVISHNEIHDFCYSGMSIGWNWDDAPTAATTTSSS